MLPLACIVSTASLVWPVARHDVQAVTGLAINTGLAVKADAPAPFHLVDGHAIFAVDEEQQGNADLNADGDEEDSVLHVLDLRSRRTSNLGVAGNFESLGDGRLVVYSDEDAQGSDLTGDGDLNDWSFFVFDLRRGWLRNLGVAGYEAKPVGGSVSIGVPESAQGFGDLNGDGDTEDVFLHVYDPRSQTFVNTGLGKGLSGVAVGAHLAFQVSELFQGEDANGDGDLSDNVLHILDVAQRTTINTGLATAWFLPQLDGPGSQVVFLASEQGGNQDLNGDGDTWDAVAHLVDVETGASQNLGVAVPAGLSGVALAWMEAYLLLGVSEAAQAADLNGDGDTLDVVVHSYDTVEGEMRNLQLAIDPSQRLSMQVAGSRVAIRVLEASQGGIDLTNDGDAVDRVAFLYDAPTHTTSNLGLPVPKGLFNYDAFLRPLGSRVGLVVDESHVGQDLNGDGDAGTGTADHVLQVVGGDGSPCGPNLALTTDYVYSNVSAVGSLIAFSVQETSQNQDLNGNGDLGDDVLHIWDAATCRGWVVELAKDTSILMDDEFVLFSVDEQGEGADLNGDGDKFDKVLHYLPLAELPR